MLQFTPIKLLYNDLKILTFEQFTKKIQQKELKQTIHSFLKLLSIENCHPHYLLTLFLIYGYKDFILDSGKLSKDLFTITEKILDNIREFISQEKVSLQQKNKLVSQIKKYVKLFQKWKKKDIVNQIIYYSDSYYELQTINDKNSETVYKTEITKIQNKLRKKIKQLDKENGLEFLNNYKQVYLQQKKEETTKLKQTITKTMKKAYWNQLSFLLNQNPPDLSWIPNILKDINCSLKKLVPNNDKYKERIDEYIDWEFLGKQITTNSFEFTSIFSLADFILTTLQELGIPEKDKEIKKLKQWIVNNQSNSNFKLHIFLPKLFREIMERIEEIQLLITFINKNNCQKKNI